MTIKNRSVLLVFLVLILLSACGKSPQGAGTKALDKSFYQSSFNKIVYSQSMIRAAANVAKLDSTHILTQKIEYVLQFKLEKKSRFYAAKADSTVLWNLKNDGLETLASYEEAEYKMFLFLKNDGEIVQNLVFVRSDTTHFELMEFVGKIPMKTLIAQGWTNIQNFENILNLNLLPDATRNIKNN